MTQLPEKIMWDETSMSSLDAYMSETINLIINYLKEREEPVLTPVAEAVRAEERERIMKWSSDNFSRSTQPLYAHVDLLDLQKALSPNQEK